LWWGFVAFGAARRGCPDGDESFDPSDLCALASRTFLRIGTRSDRGERSQTSSISSRPMERTSMMRALPADDARPARVDQPSSLAGID
jgi:hypothetical protein